MRVPHGYLSDGACDNLKSLAFRAEAQERVLSGHFGVWAGMTVWVEVFQYCVIAGFDGN